MVASALAAVARAQAVLAAAPCRQAPLVLAFDDVERTTASARADLAAFARGLSGPVMLLLAVSSPEGLELDEVVAIDTLTSDESAALAASALRGEVPPGLAGEIAALHEPGAVLEAL